MSKIAEQKALEAYPVLISKDSVEEGFDWNEEYREVYSQGYDQSMQDFLEKAEQYKTVYVVTRSDLYYDEVEKVFFDKNKAEEYCKPFNEDKNSDHRNITEIEVTL